MFRGVSLIFLLFFCDDSCCRRRFATPLLSLLMACMPLNCIFLGIVFYAIQFHFYLAWVRILLGPSSSFARLGVLFYSALLFTRFGDTSFLTQDGFVFHSAWFCITLGRAMYLTHYGIIFYSGWLRIFLNLGIYCTQFGNIFYTVSCTFLCLPSLNPLYAVSLPYLHYTFLIYMYYFA